MNKLTPEKFEPLSNDLLSLNLNSKTILIGVIHLIFEKALDEPKYSSMYAQLCRRISKEGSTLEAENDYFETLLIRVCRDKFINRSQYSESIINSPSTGDPNETDEEERKYVAKQKILGNVKFIGELFKLEMLNAAILHKMLEQLLDRKSRSYPTLEDRCEDMECLSQIWRTCGNQLDTEKSKNLIDQYFDIMESKSNSSKYPPRIRFLLRDVIELRKDGWKPRKVARIDGPMPIQDLSTDEEYIRQQRDMRTRSMEYQNRNNDRNWMDKLPLSLQSMNNNYGTLSMTSSSSLISGPYNPSGNNYNSRDGPMMGGGGGGGGGGYRNNNIQHRNHDNNSRPMNNMGKYNNQNDGKMNQNKMKHPNNMNHRQHDGMGNQNHHGDKYEKYDKYDKYHSNSNNQNSFNNNNNINNNMLNKELAPRFKRNIVTPSTPNSVDDLQMRPSPNSLLFKASSMKSNQQMPLAQPSRSATGSPGFPSSTVDNLIPSFNNATLSNGKNHPAPALQQPLVQTPMGAPQPNQQTTHFMTAAAQAAKNGISQNNGKPALAQPTSPQNSSKDQQLVTKQGSVEKPKQKKDKGPTKEEVMKKVAQFISESLLEKKFVEGYQEIKENSDKELITEITDTHNNNGHTNGSAEIIENCENGEEVKDNSLNDSVGGEDENAIPTLEDIVKSYYDLKVPEKFLKDSVMKLINDSLDKGEQVHEIIVDFMQAMQKDKKLSANQLAESLRGVINGMSEREKTIPKVTTLVASLIARCITKKISKLTDVANFTENGQHYPLLLLVLQHLHKSIGDDPLVVMFAASKINIMPSLPECDRTKDRLAEILDDRKLSFLQPLLRIESELWRQIQADPQPQAFYKWIKDNVDPLRYTDPGFVTALTTVLLKFISQVRSSLNL